MISEGAADEIYADMSVVIIDVAEKLGLPIMDLLNTFLNGIQDMGIDITEKLTIERESEVTNKNGSEYGEDGYSFWAEAERSTEEVEGVYEANHEELDHRKAIYRRS